MTRYLLEFGGVADEHFSKFLSKGAEVFGGYAGMTEVRVCHRCAAVVTDLRYHLERTHDETYSDEAWDIREEHYR